MQARFLVAVLLFMPAGCAHSIAQHSPPAEGSPSAPTPRNAGSVHIGSSSGPKMIHYVRPVYPAWARKQHLEGIVEFRAIIGKDGRIKKLTFVKGPKALRPYAESAVRQWRYEPPTLNGMPIEIVTDIRVQFSLSA